MPAKAWSGEGRPSAAVSEERRREFVALVVAGTPLAEAQRRSRIKAERALALLDDPTLRRLIVCPAEAAA